MKVSNQLPCRRGTSVGGRDHARGPIAPNSKGHVNGPQFTAGFFSLFRFETTLHFLNVEGLVEVHTAKENVQGTIDHNYSLQKNTWIMVHLKTQDVLHGLCWGSQAPLRVSSSRLMV